MPTFALVSDFDGTISNNDFFYYIAERYFDEKALTPWHEYLAGTKKHFTALSEMFAGLRISEEELQEFIKTIKLDKTFFTLAAYCQKQNIPVYICSAGCDYYIKVLLNEKIKPKHQIENKIIKHKYFLHNTITAQIMIPSTI